MADDKPIPKRGPRGDASNAVRAAIISSSFFPPAARLNRLRKMVDQLAVAIERGDVMPLPGELELVAEILQGSGLHTEAQRVARWLGK